jgi:eukaryotic-like serine/threonine-protein kinase
MITEGTKLGRYEIIRQLGAGGMGEVYLANDTKLDRKVALKILPPEFAEDSDRMSRFVREAKSASVLNHPNIITIYEIGEDNETHYIATEHIEGETLFERLKNENLSLKLVLDIAVQIVSALQVAHSASIIHRDIKPENIMIRAGNLVKILDFGIAKLLEQRSESIDQEAATAIKAPPTKSGTIIGTANYMSPEQAAGKEVDARSDIFSFGLVLYEMLSGKRAFEGENSLEIISSILKDEPQPIHQLLPALPREIERIVGKTLRKDREERYQTARGLLTDLKDARQELEFHEKLKRTSAPNTEEAQTQMIDAPTDDVPHTTTSAKLFGQKVKKHKSRIAAALLILLFATIGSGYWYFFYLSASGKQIESIAVLPFVNESGDADVEYLSDGMTETLIGSLSQIPNLNVKARSSVFRYKGREVLASAVGKELNVQAVLTGRVVQRGEQLTLYVELVDAATENSLWKQSYNKTMTNLIALQTDVARDVADRLKVKLSGADEKKLTKNYTANSEAYQLYLKGRYQTIKLSPQEILKGVSYFQEAIRLDPNYALAHVGLSDAYRSLALGGEQLPNEYFPKAKMAANRAIEIDDTLGEAHAVLGFIIYWYDWDWATSEKHLKRALELNPNNSDAHFFYGQFLSTLGRYDEGLAEFKRARDLEPLNARTASLEARFLASAGKRDESIAAFRKIFEINPDYWFAYTQAANSYNNEKMYTEAAAAARKARGLNEFSSQAIALEGYALAKSGRQAEARAALQELLRLSEQRNVPPTNIAMVYCGLNEKDKALTWLERSYRDKDARIVFLKIDRLWDDLRDTPRFQDLLRRMELS